MIVTAALLLDAAFGEPDWLWTRLPHPAVLMGGAVQVADTRLNAGAHRRAKGLLAIALLCALAVLAALIVAAIPLGPAPEILVAAILLAQRSLCDHVTAVARALRQSLPEGRRAVARIVSRDTGTMDQSAVARSAIESAAENLSDGVVAPAFWLAVGGLPGLMVYKIVNTAESMIGYRTPRHADFGWAAARLDDLLNLVPARLTAVLIAATSGCIAALPDIRRDAAIHRSPNAGWPEAAMARALDIALAGPRSYDGRMRDFPFVHECGRRALTPEDIDAAVRRLWRAWAVLLALSMLLAVA